MTEQAERTNHDFEMFRLKIMAEVNAKFEEVLCELNKNGSEFSRALKVEIIELREKAKCEIEELWSWAKSKLVGIEHGQQILYDPNDGIMTRALRKVEEAVKMARDAAACTLQSSESAEESSGLVKEARDEVKATRVLTATNGIVQATAYFALTVTVIFGYLAVVNKAKDDIKAQQAVVEELKKKSIQDAANQKQLMGVLDSMVSKLQHIR